MSIFQVLSNLNHDGTTHAKGSFFEGEIAQFADLVKINVLKVVEGAKDIAHAKTLIAEEEAKTEAEKTEVKQSENTWGPKPDPVPSEKTTDNTPAPKAGEVTGTPAPEAPKTTGDAAPLDLNAGLNL